MKDDDITCAYGFDKLDPAGQRIFKDFLRVLKAIKAEPLYPTFSKEQKAKMFERIQKEIKDDERKAQECHDGGATNAPDKPLV